MARMVEEGRCGVDRYITQTTVTSSDVFTKLETLRLHRYSRRGAFLTITRRASLEQCSPRPPILTMCKEAQ